MTNERDPPKDEERPVGLLGAIRLMVDTLVDAEREGKTTFRKSGRIPDNHFTTEYGFSGQIGGSRRPADSQPDSRSQSAGSTGSIRDESDSHRVDVRKLDDGLLVIADMPDVEVEDITTGINEERDELVLRVGHETVERMELPWPVEDVQARFQHGILELRFTRKEDDQ